MRGGTRRRIPGDLSWWHGRGCLRHAVYLLGAQYELITFISLCVSVTHKLINIIIHKRVQDSSNLLKILHVLIVHSEDGVNCLKEVTGILRKLITTKSMVNIAYSELDLAQDTLSPILSILCPRYLYVLTTSFYNKFCTTYSLNS